MSENNQDPKTLKELRESKKLSQEGLARLVDCSLTSIRNYEAQPPRRYPGFHIALRLCKVLDLSLPELAEILGLDTTEIKH